MPKSPPAGFGGVDAAPNRPVLGCAADVDAPKFREGKAELVAGCCGAAVALPKLKLGALDVAAGVEVEPKPLNRPVLAAGWAAG